MFSRVLVANRGEIAVRVIRALHELGIEAVAVYSTADSEALHVRLADPAVCIGPPAAAESYLRIPSVVAAAVTTGCEAVHPGYGFLAENPAFARACADNDLVFVGPSPEVMERLGDKACAKAGAPLGDGALYLEKVVAPARHVEIQVLCDRHGNVLTLGERECSIQRRHQKPVEESPSPALSPQTRQEKHAAVERACRAVGYEGAGTFEFLLGLEGEPYFIEVNCRLKGETRVTEMVTGGDIV